MSELRPRTKDWSGERGSETLEIGLCGVREGLSKKAVRIHISMEPVVSFIRVCQRRIHGDSRQHESERVSFADAVYA